LAGVTPGVVVDCTLGLGGHSGALMAARGDLRVIGLDVDEGNLATARARLSEFGDRLTTARANFGEIGRGLAGLGQGPVGGILADLGVSSNQISDSAKGLSFDVEGPLDMRLDSRVSTTAADLVNGLGEGELADLLYLQSGERHSRRI